MGKWESGQVRGQLAADIRRHTQIMNFKRKKIGSCEDRKLGSWGKKEGSAAEMGWARGREDMEGLER